MASRHLRSALSLLVVFAAVAYVIAPFKYGDVSLLAGPDVDLDAIQQALLLREGMDKLLSQPGAYYDTAILYPDRTQLRTTEPLLGFVLIALPIHLVLRPTDADLFEVLRWVLVLASLIYAYLFYTTVGLGRAVSIAGAILCWSLDISLYGIERLQVVSIPLIFGVFYHGLMVWTSPHGRVAHSVGLFVLCALYPLCGAINATIVALAGLLVIPWLLTMMRGLYRQRRLTLLLLPIVLAVVVDVAVLSPWLFDRADLAAYAGDAFLQVKHWNPIGFPAGAPDLPRYIDGLLGPALLGALLVSLLAAVTRSFRSSQAARHLAIRPPPERYFWPLLTAFALLLAAVMLRATAPIVSCLQFVFHAVGWGTLLLFWRVQTRRSPPEPRNMTRAAVTLGLGLGIFMCLMSFGPVYVSNPSPFANSILRVLVEIASPLTMIREYSRFWSFGFLFLSIYATVRLGLALRPCHRAVRLGAVIAIVTTTLWLAHSRPLVASERVEPPRDLVYVLSHSRGTGGVYVHPELIWNSRSGVFMIAVARQVRRPIVNGYLGIMPPWFAYAKSVLDKFPDPEALWLLRKWGVESVVTLAGSVTEVPSDLHKVMDHEGMALWEIGPARDEKHPSETGGSASSMLTRVELAWAPAPQSPTDGLILQLPGRLQPQALEIHFAQSVLERVPEVVNVYAFNGVRGTRLNLGRSGEWIESLAADALVRREWPVATIRLLQVDSRELLVDFQKSPEPLIKRIFVLGDWCEGCAGDDSPM